MAAHAGFVVVSELLQLFGIADDDPVLDEAFYLSDMVAAVVPDKGIGDPPLVPHALQGADTHVQHDRHLTGREPCLRSAALFLTLFFLFLYIGGYSLYPAYQFLVCGTLQCYDFHTLCF
ncbi:putative uncharacterized protein [Eggerthella sp. CAG:1427]|nr:putative uncharacterized protein [Eggerthella sp. CAG:1427]